MDPTIEPVPASCPYCGEAFETVLDTPEDGMRYIEDCPVCCQPIEFTVRAAPGGGYTVDAAREND